MSRFPNGARVCFLGDSITAMNIYPSYIIAAYKETYPDAGIEFYNCGVSGGGAYTMLHQLEGDILPHAPTHATLMTGVNDAELWYLEQPHGSYRFNALARAATRYRDNMHILVERMLENNIALTLLTPPPYAEYNDGNKPWQGGAAVLTSYADFVTALGKEYALPVIDVQTHLIRENEKRPLFAPDHVHPIPEGAFEIAKCILAAQGIDAGEYHKLPSFMDEWQEVVLQERTVCWMQRNVIPYVIKDDDKRIAFVKDFLEKKKYPNDMFKTVAERYLKVKPEEAFWKQEAIRVSKSLAGKNN